MHVATLEDQRMQGYGQLRGHQEGMERRGILDLSGLIGLQDSSWSSLYIYIYIHVYLQSYTVKTCKYLYIHKLYINAIVCISCQNFYPNTIANPLQVQECRLVKAQAKAILVELKKMRA